MILSGRLRAADLWPLIFGGLSMGVAAATFGDSSALPLLLLLILGVICEWLQVQLGTLGAITLRPVVAFVALWQTGIGGLLVVGIVPILVVQLFVRRRGLTHAMEQIGQEAVALVTTLLVLGLVGRWMPTDTGGLLRVGMQALVMSAYWIVQMLLRAARLQYVEGMRLRAAVANLAHSGCGHAVVMVLSVIALSYIADLFGLMITMLASVVLVEAYYPWKLLGDQGGVLITSLQMMAQAVDLKDPYTSNHSQRVSRHAVRLARALGLPEREVERIRIGALMHDLGKIGISGRIIRKPDKLTPEEQAVMRQHSSVSANIIGPLEILGESASMVRHHHEHWDGSGYPDGLRAQEIPIGSRIILVADAFDALVSDRPYRRGVARSDAVEVIRRHSGTQFDPAVVAALERVYASL